MMKTYRYFLLIIYTLLTLTACGIQDPGITVATNGLSVTLQADPVPQVGAESEWYITLLDSTKQPVSFCKTTVRQYMPGMEMALDNVFGLMEEINPGRYWGKSTEFTMGGDWIIEANFNCSGKAWVTEFKYHLEWPE